MLGRTMSSNNRRLAYALAALLGLAAISTGLWRLWGAETGLRIANTLVQGIPVTVFAPDQTQPAPVVVIGHGFAGSRQLMHPFAVTLARNGYVAVVFDFPGHGRNRNPLRGEIGEPTRVESLLDALSKVVAYARTLPDGDGRLALLGHSMAGDILVRYMKQDPSVAAGIAVSPYLSEDLSAGGPPNLLFIYGGLEPDMILNQGRAAVAAVAGLPPAQVQRDLTYGSLADGSARRLVVADGVEHIGVLYSTSALRAALDWLNQVFGRSSSGVVDARGPWLGLFYLGVLLLAWPLSTLLPRVADRPLGAGLGWRRLLPIAMLPAILTPVILAPLPNDFLSIVIGDYIALHFGLYGLLTWLGLWLTGTRPAALRRGISTAAFGIALLAVAAYEVFALTLPTDRFVTSFLPGSERLPFVLVLFVGTLLWFSADEWLTRGAATPRAAYALTKVLFLVSLMLAVVLNLSELFFLVIIIPAILALFVVYGLFSGWIYRRTNDPWVAAVTNALAFAAAVAVSFPIVG